MALNYYSLTAATRKEIQVELIPFEGQIPDDLYGHVLFNSMVGTISSNGTPIPEYLKDGSLNPEYGSMIFNGDGMVLRFDFDEAGKVKLKTGILRTPCYFADEATQLGTNFRNKNPEYYFYSAGIARNGILIGSRNQLNTAFTPFKFPGDKNTRLTANFDAGRPFEIDPVSLSVKTPIGACQEWRQEFPQLTGVESVFELVQTSAHPSFDPVTKEFFTVCFTKNFDNLFFDDLLKGVKSLDDLEQRFKNIIENDLKLLADLLKDYNLDLPKLISLLVAFFESEKKGVHNNSLQSFTEDNLKDLIDSVTTNPPFKDENSVTLLKWNGVKNEPLKQWKVVDSKTGKNIEIIQTMHQTNFSKDYILLVDTSLKFALDMLFTRPKEKDPLWKLLRIILSRKMMPVTPYYIIKRADLNPNSDTVKAIQAQFPIETVHFSIDYQNPNNTITVHTAHNAASCVAEWVRPSDHLAYSFGTPVAKNTIGIMTTGEMDLGRVGKFVINGETGEIQEPESKFLMDKGFDGTSFKDLKGHTWAVGLNTFRDIISPDKPVDKINQIFWQSYGLDKRFLTEYVFDLYFTYKNRIIPVEDLMNYYKEGIPFCLFRQDTHTMKIEDYYVFKMNQNFRSMQFMPRKAHSTKGNNPNPELDGYIFCTMINGIEDIDHDQDQYSREIWIFDAANLKNGPVCKLSHPDMIYSFTIHSAWIEDCASSELGYYIPVKEDYDEVISNFKDLNHKKIIQSLMDTVYLNFPPKPVNH